MASLTLEKCSDYCRDIWKHGDLKVSGDGWNLKQEVGIGRMRDLERKLVFCAETRDGWEWADTDSEEGIPLLAETMHAIINGRVWNEEDGEWVAP